MSENKVTYVVNVPVELTAELQNFLKERNVDFRPQDQAIQLNDSGNDPQVLMGYEAKNLVPRLNEILKNHKDRPLVPGNPENWTLPQLHEFLELAMDHFSWDEKNRPTWAWWIEEEVPWSDIVSKYPQLFGATKPDPTKRNQALGNCKTPQTG